MSLTPKQQRALALHIEAALICVAALCFLMYFVQFLGGIYGYRNVGVLVALLMIFAVFACLIGLVIGIIRKHWQE